MLVTRVSSFFLKFMENIEIIDFFLKLSILFNPFKIK